MSFALIDWDDGYSNDIPTTLIQNPRKNVDQYQPGERVQARISGFKGLHWGEIAAIDDDRKKLKEIIKRKIPVKSTDDSSVHLVGTEIKDIGVSYNDSRQDNDDSRQDLQVTTDIPPIKKKKKDLPVNDEAKKVKAEANKKERQAAREREKVLKQVSDEILGTSFSTVGQAASFDGVDLVSKQTVPAEMMETLLENVKSLDKKMGSLERKIDLLLDCKDCLRRAYKNVERKEKTGLTSSTISTSTPKPLKILTTSTSTTSSTSTSSTTSSTSTPKPLRTLTTSTSSTTSSTSTPKQKENDDNSMDTSMDTSMESIDTNEIITPAVDTPDVLNAYVGDAKYGITMRKEDYIRCISTAKTPEKLLLNILEFVLTKEEIENCTVYGNKQHNKKALDENKRFALKSQVFSTFYQVKDKSERHQEWEKLVKVINDKIRGMRKGKYKSIIN